MLAEAGFPQHGSFRGRGRKEGLQNVLSHPKNHSYPPKKSGRMLQSVEEQLNDSFVPCLMSPPAIEGSVLAWALAE